MERTPLQSAYTYHRRTGKPACVALTLARADVASGKRRYPSSLCGAWNPPFAAYGERHLRWIESTARAGLRFVGHADEILDLRHTGWYADAFQDSLLRGAVYQLPARHGAPAYVYGHDDPNNPGAALLSFDWTDDKRDAARWADSIAERAAEQEREYQEASSARLRFDESADEIAELRRKALAILADRRKVDLSQATGIATTLRERVAEIHDEIAELRRKRQELESDFGESEGWQG